eukprot:Gregarina_sp_Poly_1__400@NODE_109_length_14014_cov_141_998351_g96_i0_p6_GENE_NODE_109_length_14014_cov_141_998351_g96_i0NODE_109_length_14014_cov_141_998351_g96_i0_p6_ORF_typecomplete_len475_score81_93_NODE_109_length_14014_cov_141_998351_g96_i047046128
MRLLTEQASNSWTAANSAVSVSVSSALTPSSSAPPAPPDFRQPIGGSGSGPSSPLGDGAGEDDEEGALPDESDGLEEDEGAGEARDAEETASTALEATSLTRGRSIPGTRRASGLPESQWSWSGGRRIDRDSYFQCLVPHIQAPNAEDNYYLAALRNAFNTLNEYAQFIGVDGSEFLKHLFSYYILGPRLTTDLLRRLALISERSGCVDESTSIPRIGESRSSRKHIGSTFTEGAEPPSKKRRLRRRTDVSLSDPDPVPSTMTINLGPTAVSTPSPVSVSTLNPSAVSPLSPVAIPPTSSSLLIPSRAAISAPTTSVSDRDPPSQESAPVPDESDRLSDITDRESESAKSILSDLSSSSSDEDDEAPIVVPKKFHREQIVSSTAVTPGRTPTPRSLAQQLRSQLEQRLAHRQECLKKMRLWNSSRPKGDSLHRMNLLISRLEEQITTLKLMCLDKGVTVEDLLMRYAEDWRDSH